MSSARRSSRRGAGLRAAVCIGLGIGLCAYLCGCGAKSRPLDELQYWNGFTGPDGNITEPLIRDFQAASGLRVEVQKMPWSTYFDKLIAAIAAGDPPDLFVLHFSELAAYAEMGALLPLDDLVDTDDSFVPHADRIESVWDRCMYEGRRYGVPLDVHMLGLYYNKDLFDRAGLPYPSETEPITGDELIALAKALNIDENGDGKPDIWGFTFAGSPFRNFSSLLWQFGGDLLSPGLDEVTIDAPAGHAALQWMVDCVEEHGISPPPEGLDTWQHFLQGRVALFTEGCWVLNGIKQNAKFRWGVAPLFVAGEQPAVWATGHVLCLPRNLPEARRANAVRLMQYLSDTGVTWSTSGMIPARHSQITDPTFEADALLRPFVAQLDHVRFEPDSPVGIELRDRYEQSIVTALTGIAPVDVALDRAASRMRRVLAWWEE